MSPINILAYAWHQLGRHLHSVARNVNQLSTPYSPLHHAPRLGHAHKVPLLYCDLNQNFPLDPVNRSYISFFSFKSSINANTSSAERFPASNTNSSKFTVASSSAVSEIARTTANGVLN